MTPTACPDPHDFAGNRRHAEHLRQESTDDVWRGADAALARVCLDARARLARSTQRLQMHRQRSAHA